MSQKHTEDELVALAEQIGSKSLQYGDKLLTKHKPTAFKLLRVLSRWLDRKLDHS